MLYVLNLIVLSSISYTFQRKALAFSLFPSPAVFFSPVQTILNKLASGTIRVDPYCLFFLKKMISFCQQHIQLELHCIFQHIQILQIKISYNISHVVFSITLCNFGSNSFFLFQIYLKGTNQEKNGFTHNYHITKI